MSKLSMDDLPQDLWPIILAFMDDRTKRQMRLANTKWFYFIKYNNFNLYFTKAEDMPAITDRLSRYSWPIELSFQKNKFNNVRDVTKHLHKLTNLTKMNDSKYPAVLKGDSEDHWMQLTTLTNIQTWKFQSSKVPIELWKTFTKLTNWIIADPGGTNQIDPILKQMPNLDDIYYNSDNNVLPLVHLMNPHKLTHLNMFMKPGMEEYKEYWSYLTNLKSLICYGNTTIKPEAIDLPYLTALERCMFNSIYTLPSFSTTTNLTSLSLTCDNGSLKNASSITMLKKLQSLCIPEDTADQFNLLAGLDQLRKLALQTRTTPGPAISLSSLTNLTNLTSLALTPSQIRDFDCLTKLSTLQSLTITARHGVENIKYIEELIWLESLDIFWSCPEPLTLDLSNLTKIVTLRISADLNSKINGLKYLTNLLHLNIPLKLYPNEEVNFLSDLKKLTYLFDDSTRIDNKFFWSNLAVLTNIKKIKIDIDSDERVLDLIPFTNLTDLTIFRAPEEFTGIYLTALTSLQVLVYENRYLPTAYLISDLMRLLPNLYSCRGFYFTEADF